MNCEATFKAKGEIIDTLINTRTGEVKEFRGNNIIVEDITKLIAALIKRHTGFSGALYWENGTGLDSWDDTPVVPTKSDHALVTPLYRKEISASDIIFIDEEGVESSEPTNRIQISIRFTELESNGKLRELGIWGGNASATLGSGIIINHRIHGILTKNDEMILDRKLRLTFSLA